MPVYMTQFAYAPEAWDALVTHPEDRGRVLASHLERLGGRLICFYYAFSEYDGLAIYEVPSDTVAAAAVMAIAAPGHDKALRTTPLLTVEQAMEAMTQARGARYRPPMARADDWQPYGDG